MSVSQEASKLRSALFNQAKTDSMGAAREAEEIARSFYSLAKDIRREAEMEKMRCDT